jgi:sugar/nucleoside kinase (ribokinase family)
VANLNLLYPNIVCIGSGIVDYITFASENWLVEICVNAKKGGVVSVSENAFMSLLNSLSNPILIKAGGSAGTVIKGLGQLGSNAALISRTGDDKNGKFLRSVFEEHKIAFYGSTCEGTTAKVLCVITPDGERTFFFCGNTLCGTPHVQDLDEEVIKNSKLIHMEGYTVRNKDIIEAILKMADQYNLTTSLDLGAFTLVQEHRQFFKELLAKDIDICFGNAEEMRALFGSEPAVDEALKNRPGVSVATRGDQGCKLYCHGQVFCFPAVKSIVVDSSGAGDLFTSGFLFGITQGWSIRRCVELALYLGKSIVSYVGPELPEKAWQEVRHKFLAHR